MPPSSNPQGGKQVEERHLVIAAFWADGTPDDLAEETADVVKPLKFDPEAKGSVVCFPSGVASKTRFTAALAVLDLAEVAPFYVASFCGGPRADTADTVDTLDPIRDEGGEYRFLEIGTDYDAVFEWHANEEPTDV